jgi:hypothetical protein
MSAELSPQSPEWRLSGADRERAGERLRTALDDGRIDLDEYGERLGQVLAARTYGELAPHLADLPGAPVVMEIPESGELRATAASLKRGGRWIAPRRLQVFAKAGSVKLDFTDAVLGNRVMEIDLEVYAGSTVLVLPPGASADVDKVELTAGTAKLRGVPVIEGDGHHFIVRGRQVAGSLIVRHRRRFLRWSW